MKSGIHFLAPWLGLLSAVVFTGACGSDAETNTSNSGSTTATTGSGTGGATSSSTTGPGAGGSGGVATGGGGNGGFSVVITIVMENHDYNEVVGSADAPYVQSLIDMYGLATNYFDSGTHPSLPNYLYMASGATQYPGIVDLSPTFYPFPVKAENLGNQLEAASIPWRSYQESMGSPCNLSDNGNYATKHDPFIYFDGIQNGPNDLCAKTQVDYSGFAADLAAGTYKYMWITPNLLSDGHDPATDPVQGLKQSDAWLATELPKILESPIYKAGGVVFLCWEEAEGRNGNDPDQVPMIVISPKLKSVGFQTSTKLSHAGYLATIEEIFGLPKLGAAATATTLMEFFE